MNGLRNLEFWRICHVQRYANVSTCTSISVHKGCGNANERIGGDKWHVQGEDEGRKFWVTRHSNEFRPCSSLGGLVSPWGSLRQRSWYQRENDDNEKGELTCLLGGFRDECLRSDTFPSAAGQPTTRKGRRAARKKPRIWRVALLGRKNDGAPILVGRL
jgi:hypothetical protein